MMISLVAQQTGKKGNPRKRPKNIEKGIINMPMFNIAKFSSPLGFINETNFFCYHIT